MAADEIANAVRVSILNMQGMKSVSHETQAPEEVAR